MDVQINLPCRRRRRRRRFWWRFRSLRRQQDICRDERTLGPHQAMTARRQRELNYAEDVNK